VVAEYEIEDIRLDKELDKVIESGYLLKLSELI
jgi:hypothetical protein